MLSSDSSLEGFRYTTWIFLEVSFKIVINWSWFSMWWRGSINESNQRQVTQVETNCISNICHFVSKCGSLAKVIWLCGMIISHMVSKPIWLQNCTSYPTCICSKIPNSYFTCLFSTENNNKYVIFIVILYYLKRPLTGLPEDFKIFFQSYFQIFDTIWPEFQGFLHFPRSWCLL